MSAITLLLGLAFGTGAAECQNPPPRDTDSYWTYVDSCGCAQLDPPARASADYDRFLTACSQWRERNPLAGAVGVGAARGPECRNPPSRASDSFWSYLEACGCADVDPPSRASADYDRFLKACGRWRERNPTVVPTPSPSAKPTPTPSPSPTAPPKPKG